MTSLAGDARQPAVGPDGVRADHPTRIQHTLLTAADTRPHKVALIDGQRRFTYEALAQHSRDFASTLRRLGLRGGDRVAIYLEKSVEAVVAMYGTWLAGGVIVPVSDVLLARQVAHIVGHSGSTVLVSNARTRARLPGDLLAGLRAVEVDLASAAQAPSAEPPPSESEARAAILYTSGSTGSPKGILISHANLLAGARIVSDYLGITEEERIISIPPFNFDYGLNQLLCAVHRRATLVLQRSSLPADICRTLVHHEITGMPAVPPLWVELVEGKSPFPQMSFPHLRYVTNTGGALPVEVVRRLRELLPRTSVYLMYGLSEAFRSTYLPPEEIDRRPGSIGKGIPECEIIVLSRDGRRCGPGEVGELVHRGPTVALGYWNDPEATARVFRPNPFAPPDSSERVVYSGDLVRTDDDGFLYFVGRRDQMIKSQGYRISPSEVETIVFESGLVKEVVAKGEPDRAAGAVVVVHCVPADPGTFSAESLMAHCRREMPRYMVPRRIEVHPAFPRTASGKIDRTAVGA